MPKTRRPRKSDLEFEFFKRELEDIQSRARETDIRIDESLKRLEILIQRLILAATR